MQMTRKHGVFLIGVAAWSFLTWGMFTKNLYAAHAAGEDRPRATGSPTRCCRRQPGARRRLRRLGCEGAALALLRPQTPLARRDASPDGPGE